MKDIDYEAIAKEFGGYVVNPNNNRDIDYAEIAKEFGGTVVNKEPETTIPGIAGAATRGLALPAAGAALGAAAGAPIAGVGAIPGAIAGAGAASLAQFVGDPIISTINNMLGTRYTLPTDAMEDLMTRIGVPEARTEAERIVKAVASGVAGAGGTVALGKALQNASTPVMSAIAGQSVAPSSVAGNVGKSLASQPGLQAVGGASAGLASQSVQEMGGGTGAQLAAGIAGGALGSRLANKKFVNQPALSQEDILNAERAGINLMTSDVSPPRTFASKWMQTVGERIPLAGTGPMRQQQNKQRINAVSDFIHEFEIENTDSLPKKIVEDLLQKRSNDINKYSSLKNDVINRLSEKGKVENIKIKEVANKQIEDLEREGLSSLKPLISTVKDISDATNGQNLNDLESIRKSISEAYKSSDLSAVSTKAQKSIRDIYNAINEDMGSFILKNGTKKDFLEWKVSNKRLSNMIDELKNNSLKEVLKKGDIAPELVENILFRKNKSDIQFLSKNLTQEGRKNAKIAIISKAAKDAELDIPEGKTISPDKFSRKIKSLGDPIGIFFSKDDIKRIDGLVRVLNLTKRASDAAVSPPTGVQTAIPLSGMALSSIFGGGLTGFLGGVTAGATIGSMARIYESAPVRNILMKMPTTSPGSPEEQKLLKRLISVVQIEQQKNKDKE